MSDSSSSVLVLIGAAWCRQALAAALSSVFATHPPPFHGDTTTVTDAVPAGLPGWFACLAGVGRERPYAHHPGEGCLNRQLSSGRYSGRLHTDT